MIKKSKKKIIALGILATSILAFNPIGASAQVSENEAKDLICKNGDIYNMSYDFLKTNLQFKEEVSKDTLPQDITKEIYEFTKGNENLDYFNCGGFYYYVGVDSGQIYVYDGGSGCGTFSWVENNKAVKSWSWDRTSIIKNGKFDGWNYGGWKQLQGWSSGYENNWYYYIDGVQKTGWIYDNGNWYYCYSNGQMAHNTTIDGYYLGSNGAWTNN